MRFYMMIGYKKKWKIFVLFILFISCQQEKSVFENSRVIYVKGFPETVSLIGEKQTMMPMKVSSLYIVDTFLLVKNVDQPFFFSVYNLNNQQDMGQFVSHGRGPLEVSGVTYGGNYFYDGDSVKFWFLDVNLNKVFELNLTASVAEGKTVLTDITTFPLRFFRTFRISNTTCFSRQYDTKRISYVMHGLDGVCKKEWVLYEDVDQQSFYSLGSIEQLKPDGSKLILEMIDFNQINILDLKGGNNLTITTGDQLYTLKDIQDKKVEPYIYYRCSQCSDNRIFALYLNQKNTEWRKEKKPVEIHVFDWKGNPLYKLDIPQYLSGFSMDYKNKALYGLTVDEEIYRYDLSMFDL